MIRVFVNCPRWILLAMVVFAPLAYGCTRPWAVEKLEVSMAAVICLWLAECVIRRRMPRLSPVLAALVVVLFIQGWWMTVNAHYQCDKQLRFTPIAQMWVGLPGGVDRATEMSTMIRISVLLGIICFVSDLAQRKVWMSRLFWTVGLTGTAFAAFGLEQKSTGWPLIFPLRGPAVNRFFGTYYYHGNAGAFLNLVLPIVAGLAWVSLRRKGAHAARAIWISGLLICIAAAFINVSRAAAAITMLLMLLMVIWLGFKLRETMKSRSLSLILIYAGVILAALVCVVTSVGFDATWNRWWEFKNQLTGENQRLLAAEVCWKMKQDSGFWGFGPGTFPITFPHYTQNLGNKVEGFWEFAHQDYLQTLIEWGWFGLSAWVILFGGAVGHGLWKFNRLRRRSPDDAVMVAVTMLAIGGVALHATVDFPLQIASLQFYVAIYLGILWCPIFLPGRTGKTAKDSK